MDVQTLVNPADTSFLRETKQGSLGRIAQDLIVTAALFQVRVVANQGAFQEMSEPGPARNFL